MHRLTYCAALTCLAALVHAQTTPAPTPPPELKQLNYFVGKSSCEGIIKASNTKRVWTGQCRWLKGDFVLECRALYTAPSESEAVSVFAYNTEEKAYTAYSYGSTGANPSVYKGQRTGTTWTFVREGTVGGKPTKFQVVMTEDSAGKWSYQNRRAVEGGPWTVTQESSCTQGK